MAADRREMVVDEDWRDVVELTTGQVSFGPPTTHAGENVGDTTLHELIIELK
jgi:hypothetical protein